MCTLISCRYKLYSTLEYCLVALVGTAFKLGLTMVQAGETSARGVYSLFSFRIKVTLILNCLFFYLTRIWRFVGSIYTLIILVIENSGIFHAISKILVFSKPYGKYWYFPCHIENTGILQTILYTSIDILSSHIVPRFHMYDTDFRSA